MIFLHRDGEPFGIVEQLVATGCYRLLQVAIRLLRLVLIRTKTRLLRKTDEQSLDIKTFKKLARVTPYYLARCICYPLQAPQ